MLNIRKFAVTSLLFSLVALPSVSMAQLAEPNDAGVTMGHLHFNAADVPAAQAFWRTLGGKQRQAGPLTMIVFPGVRVLVAEGEPENGSVGTVINHIGFQVPDVNAAYERWTAAGLDVERGGFAGQLWVNGPGGARIEILQNAELTVPIRFHHIHWDTQAISDIQAWYARMFGAVPGKRGNFEAADIPGANLTFTDISKGAELLPTRGTALDHIGLEVTDLRATIARLKANGVELDSDYREIPNVAALAFLTDPWGTRIELTQDLAH